MIKKIYTCKLCCYTAKTRQAFSQHIRTIKHNKMLELEQKNNTNKIVYSRKKSDDIENCIPNLEIPHIIDEITQNYSKLLKFTHK